MVVAVATWSSSGGPGLRLRLAAPARRRALNFVSFAEDLHWERRAALQEYMRKEQAPAPASADTREMAGASIQVALHQRKSGGRGCLRKRVGMFDLIHA